MAAEAVGFMSRGASGGRAAGLVTRDFLGGCAAADDARHDAVVSPHPHGSVFQQLSRCSNLPCSFSLPAVLLPFAWMIMRGASKKILSGGS